MGRLGCIEGPVDVDGERAVPRLRLDGVRRTGEGGADVGDEAVEAAESLVDLADGGGHLVPVTDVAGHGEPLPLETGTDRFQPVPVAAVEHDGGAMGAEMLGDAPADTP